MTKLVRFDWAIKHLFRNKANFDILEGFLSELMSEPGLKIETVLESESNKEEEKDKFNRVDVLVKTQQGKHIIVEVQSYRQWDFLTRILYGTSKMICEYLKQGDNYQEVVKVVSVNIVFFDLGAGKDYLYKGETIFKGMHYQDVLMLNEKEQKIYEPIHNTLCQTPTEIFPEYYIIKVARFHEQVQDKVDEWIYFLKHGQIKEEFSARGLKSASKKLAVLTLSEEDRKAYERYQTFLRDDASFNATLAVEKEVALKKSREEGRAEGREEGKAIGMEKGEAIGIEKGKCAIALNLIKSGNMTLEMISNITGLSLEELRALK